MDFVRKSHKQKYKNSNENKEDMVNKREFINGINNQLNDALNKEYAKAYESMKKQLLNAGRTPDQAERELEAIKQETQVLMINRFKEKIKENSDKKTQESRQLPSP